MENILNVSKIILKGHIKVPRQELDTIKQHLRVHIELTRMEKGCLVFNVEPDPSDECRFNVYEEFDSKSSFEFHQQRLLSSDWGRVSKNVERLYSIEGM